MLCLLLAACGQKVPAVAESKPAAMQGLAGIWTVARTVPARGEPTMSAAEATTWVGGSVQIDRDGHLAFDFDQTPTAKAWFSDGLLCTLANGGDPLVRATTDFFDPARDPLVELHLTEKEIRICTTACKDHPFASFVLNGHGEMIVHWQGVFFVLVKG